MNKKLVSLVLSGLIVLNNTGSLENVYADSDNKSKEIINNEDTKSNRVVYLEDGEGVEGIGDGSIDKPYQNIRTALEKIQNGDTLKIKGTVQYTKYKQDNNGAALPLEIDKAITIEGEAGAVLSVNAPIQLKANVNFKNLNLELVPEVSLGRSTTKSSEKILGTFIERSATIYVNGNELTLDNVNTRVGKNPNQYNDRPYISGGSHKSSTAPTGKSVINIINSNDETRFSGIYAGDYNKDVTLNVDINIDGKARVTDNKIYTGGYNKNLNGTVNINLSGKSNTITRFDNANHNGEINVNLEQNAFVYNFDATNINNLTLEENSKIILSKDATFNVNNVVLKNDATIDFREMTENNLTVKGNFTGEAITDSSKKGGIVVLGRSQVLDINGQLSGTTRLSHSNVEMFEDGRVYVKAKEVSDGEFILEDGIFDYYELDQVNNGNGIEWKIVLLKEIFDSFEWIDEEKFEATNLGNNSARGVFKIKFKNTNGLEYVPFDELYTDFKYTLTVVDEDGKKEVIEFDEDTSEGKSKDGNIAFYFIGDGSEVRIEVCAENIDKIKNKRITLKTTHIESKKSISKVLYNDLKTPELEVPDEDIKPDKEGWIKASTLAQANKLWDYTINEQNKTIVLNSFKGINTQKNTDVKIEIPRVIDGYKVALADLKSDMFPGVTHIQVAEAKDDEGQVKVLAKSLVNGFKDNDTLKYVNFDGLDVSGVDDMYGLFSFCKNLRVINISDWVIKDTTNITAMFYAKKDSTDAEKKILVISNDPRINQYGYQASNRIPCTVLFSGEGGHFLGDENILNMVAARYVINPGVLENLDEIIEQDLAFAGTPSREGYKFIEWYTDDATPTNFYELLNMTYKARWEKVVEPEVPGDDFDSDMNVNPDTDQVVDDTPVTLPDDVPVDTTDTPTVLPDDVPVENVKPEPEMPESDFDNGMNVVPENPNETPGDDFDSDMNVNPDTDQVVDDTPVTLPDDVPVDTTDTPTVLPDDVPVENIKPSIPETPVVPEQPGTTPEQPVVPETPSIPETPVAPSKPEQVIIEEISKIEGIEVESGNATIENPISVKVDTVSGITDLLEYYTSNEFDVQSVQKPEEEDNFLVYLLKITKTTLTRAEESYFIKVKVAKDNEEVIQKLESVVDTNNENDATIEDETNNNTNGDVNNSTSNNNTNSNITDNNTPNNNVNSNLNNNTSQNNSNEANKEESPKTYDGGIGSYLLSGIGSIGLLSILSKNKKRKK